MEAIQEYAQLTDNFVIVDRGRKKQEKSVVLIEEGIYKGYGYFNTRSKQPQRYEDFIDFVTPQRDNSDIQSILRQYLKNEKDDSKLVYKD